MFTSLLRPLHVSSIWDIQYRRRVMSRAIPESGVVKNIHGSHMSPP